jgi:hypothetical protein
MTRKIASALFALLTAISLLGTSALAQDTSKLEQELQGVQAGYMRMYMVDPDATPVSEVVEHGDTTHTVMVMAYRFDSPDSAASALETYATDGMKQFFDGDTEREDIPDLGDQAVQVSGTTQVGDEDDPTVVVLVQEGTDVYMVLAMNGDDTLAEQVVEMATTIVDEDVPDNEIELDPNGGSTGRIFDVFAAAEDHELVAGLVPVMDMDLMVGREQATPAS